MSKVVLIACAAKKRERPAPARELYQSSLFRLSLAYAERLRPDAIHILSAKHGLVDLDQLLAPYDLTLNALPYRSVKAWAQGALEELADRYELARDVFVFLAGTKYRKYLIPELAHAEVPLEGLTIGRQLRWLAERT
ncbi:MAG TPA: hypothetical protein VFA95_11560 [Gammaproteobacteria bacterium]|nr:hypothetical protein [Gammaproteobacteria bacterium]